MNVKPPEARRCQDEVELTDEKSANTNMIKMTIAQVAATLHPAAGGLPRTVVQLADAMADLEEMDNIYNVEKAGGVFQMIGGVAEAKINGHEVTPEEFLTYVLCYGHSTVENVRKIMGKQIDQSVKKSISLYNSKDIQAKLEKGKEIYTYEDFMKPETRQVIRAMADVLNEMGTY